MKKLLIIAGVGVGAYMVFGFKGLDGQTVWQRYFGKRIDPKKPTEPKTNADGCGCGCSGGAGSANRIFRTNNVRADINFKPNK